MGKWTEVNIHLPGSIMTEYMSPRQFREFANHIHNHEHDNDMVDFHSLKVRAPHAEKHKFSVRPSSVLGFNHIIFDKEIDWEDEV